MKTAARPLAPALALLLSVVGVPAVAGPNPFRVATGFEGIAFTEATAPDPGVAAGPDRLVLVGNWSILLRDKQGRLLASALFRDFFRAAPAPNTGGFNPRALFDRRSKRFFVVTTDFVDQPCAAGACVAHLLLAVSKGPGPRSLGAEDWHFYALDATVDGDQPTTNFADLPLLGMNDSAVVISSGMVDINERRTKYSKVRILAKAGLLTGELAEWTDLIEMREPQTGDFAWQLVPSVSPGDGRIWFLTVPFTASCSVTVWALDDPLTAPRLSSRVAASSGDCPAPPPPAQPGTAKPFDWTFNAIFGGIVHHASSLWTAQSIGRDGVAALRWVEVDVGAWPASVRFLQDAVVAEPQASLFCPTMAVDSRGNALVAFARTSATEFASLNFVARLAGDPANTMRPGVLLRTSQVALERPDSSPFHTGENRYGNYFGVGIDPGSDQGFWIHGEYVRTPLEWGSWVSKVSVPPAPVRRRRTP